MWFDVGANNIRGVVAAWLYGFAPIISLVLGALFLSMLGLMTVYITKELGHIGEGSVSWGFSGSSGFGRGAGNAVAWGQTGMARLQAASSEAGNDGTFRNRMAAIDGELDALDFGLEEVMSNSPDSALAESPELMSIYRNLRFDEGSALADPANGDLRNIYDSLELGGDEA